MRSLKISLILILCSKATPDPGDLIDYDYQEMIPISTIESVLSIIGLEGLDYRLGGCCSPLPGEKIVGSVALGNHGISIHRQNCININSVPYSRQLPVTWNENLSTDDQKFATQLRIEVIDRVGVLKDILMRLSDNGINVSDARVQTSHAKPACKDLRIEIKNSEQLMLTINKIRAMADVIDIARTSLN